MGIGLRVAARGAWQYLQIMHGGMSMEYTVVVTETLSRTVKVSAQNETEALDRIALDYYDEEIVLDYGDFVNVEFQIQ